MQNGNVIILFVLLTDDYNRVVLEPLDDTPDSDYINASYVDVSKFGSV
jgi:protein tyrosine phosphatase